MKNHQNAPKKNHHEKTCVAHSHVEAAETKDNSFAAENKDSKKH